MDKPRKSSDQSAEGAIEETSEKNSPGDPGATLAGAALEREKFQSLLNDAHLSEFDMSLDPEHIKDHDLFCATVYYWKQMREAEMPEKLASKCLYRWFDEKLEARYPYPLMEPDFDESGETHD